jgi:hypothetical protein
MGPRAALDVLEKRKILPLSGFEPCSLGTLLTDLYPVSQPHPLCLRECEALATLRHVYLGSLYMDPQDIRGLSLGAIWNFFRRVGLS